MRHVLVTISAVLITSFSPAHAERTVSDTEIKQVAFLYAMTEAECDLIDLFFTNTLTKIEVYECITWKNGVVDFVHSGRFTYINGILSVPKPIPRPGDAPALVSKTT